ncbi:MAG TPA: C40 family peptidase [Burkholderiales bacterium]
MTLAPRPRHAVMALVLLALTGCASAPRPAEPDVIGARAARYALEMQGKPYRYGGSSPRVGFDCSGLVHYSYARAGAAVARTTDALYRSSRRIPTARLRPGDLLFFNQQGKRASHVGIYLGDKRFVHAPSGGKRVSVGSLAKPYWRRHLESARRLVLD